METKINSRRLWRQNIAVASLCSAFFGLVLCGVNSAFSGTAPGRKAKSEVAVKVTEVLKQNISLLEALAAEAKEKGDTVAETAATQAVATLKASLASIEGEPAAIPSATEVSPPKPKEVNLRSPEMQTIKTEYLRERSDLDARRLAKLKELARRFLADAEADLSAKQKSGNISGIAVATKAVEIGKGWIQQLETQKDMTVPGDVRRELKEKMNVIAARKKEIDEDWMAGLENLEIRFFDSFTQKVKAQGVEEVDEEKLKNLFRQLVGVSPPARIASSETAEKTASVASSGGEPATATASIAQPTVQPVEIGRSGDATDWVPLAKWFAEVSTLMILDVPIVNRNKEETSEESNVLGGTCKTRFEPVSVLQSAEGCIFRVMSIPGNEPVEVIGWPRKANKWVLQVRVKPGAEVPSRHGIELQVSASSARLLQPVATVSASEGVETTGNGSVADGVKINISTEPPGAFVYVDKVLYREQTKIPQTPCTIVIAPGVHEILVKKPGYLDGVISGFQAKEGAQVTWTFLRDPAYVEKTVKVDAIRSWQTSGVEVKKGDSITLEVSGTWSCGSGKEKVGPEGYPNDEKYFKYYLDPKSSPRQVTEANYGALLMRIGKTGQVRAVSQNMKLKADADGAIFFDINEADDGKARRDNTGALNVKIIKVPSAK
jgi:hypothetical protein